MAHRESMTPTRELTLATETVKHARDVLGFLRSNPEAGTPAVRARVRRNHRWLLGFGIRRLAEARARIVAAEWPPHHSLWLCIHGDPRYRVGGGGGEAGSWSDRDTGGNGHWGGLQMHPGWGYGTSYYASDDSELVQEWAAENGYRANGYSRGWLIGQWGQTIGPCWRYA